MTQKEKDYIINKIEEWYRRNIDTETVYNADDELDENGNTGSVGYELLACRLVSDLQMDMRCMHRDDGIDLARQFLMSHINVAHMTEYDFTPNTIGFAKMMGDLDKFLEGN